MTRKILAALLLLALWPGITYATETCSKTDSRKNGDLPSCIAIDAAVSTATSATIDTFGYRIIGVQIWSAAGSVATVDVNCRSYSTAPWYPCYTTDNPDANSVYVSLPRAYQYQCDISAWTSGTVSCIFERYSN